MSICLPAAVRAESTFSSLIQHDRIQRHYCRKQIASEQKNLNVSEFTRLQVFNLCLGAYKVITDNYFATLNLIFRASYLKEFYIEYFDSQLNVRFLHLNQFIIGLVLYSCADLQKLVFKIQSLKSSVKNFCNWRRCVEKSIVHFR